MSLQKLLLKSFEDEGGPPNNVSRPKNSISSFMDISYETSYTSGGAAPNLRLLTGH